MTPAFADALYFIALANPRDQFHSRAVSIDLSNRPLITTQYVLMEVGDGFSQSPLRPLFVGLLNVLENWKDVRIVCACDDLFAAALDLFRRRPDKDWSLTDCTSFVVMEREGLSDAVTADRHFEQAGFNTLLK